MATGEAAAQRTDWETEGGQENSQNSRLDVGRHRQAGITVGECAPRKHWWVATAILKTEPSQSDQTRRQRPSRIQDTLAGDLAPKHRVGWHSGRAHIKDGCGLLTPPG